MTAVGCPIDPIDEEDVDFISVEANGSSSETTTELTLTFSETITGLTASNISVSGVSGVKKGKLSRSGTTYTLPISGFTDGGELTVAVSKTGYNISGSPQTVTIYYNSESGGGGGSLGNTLMITNAQVYSVEWDDDYTTPQFNLFTDTVPDLNYIYSYSNDDNYLKPLSELIDGNPSVTLKNGKLNITIGKPKNSSLLDLDTSNMPAGVTVSTTNVKQFMIGSISTRDSDYSVMQGKIDGDLESSVQYIYVNKDVNITGKYTYTGDDYTVIVNYVMYLKTGWNPVIMTVNQTVGNTSERTIKTGTPPADYHWILSQSEGGSEPGGGDVAVENVSLDQTSLSIAVGGSATLTATVEPSNATNKNVVWSSSNSAVAVVVNGTVTAISAGSAIIIVATADGGRTAICAVTVSSGGGNTPTITVTILGTPAVGNVLEADVQKDFPGDNKYQWMRNGGDILDETSSSYELPPTDADKRISVKVTVGEGADAKSATSPEVTIPNFTYTVESGKYRDILVWTEVEIGEWTYRPTVENGFSVQWFRDGAPIPGATDPEYELQDADAGKTIKAKISGYGQTAWSDEFNIPGGIITQTPVASDYDIGNLTQTAGSVTAVTITPKSGKSNGAITIKYAGSATLPQTTGTYAVTFDVAAASGWNAVTGLSAGTLTVTSGGTEGTYGDFTYTETANAVTITDYTGAGGSVTIPAQINGKPVTSIGERAFEGCTNLASVTFERADTVIANDNSFPGGSSLRTAYSAGGIGTYTRPNTSSTTWTKQP